MKMKTYVALIIDESGSMKKIRTESLNNFNEQLQTLKKESSSPDNIAKKLLIGGQEYDGIETEVSVVKFCQFVSIVVPLGQIDSVVELTDEDYNPDGTTALYDAIGETIVRFQDLPDLKDPGTSVLFVIITDGMDNASKSFNRLKVKSLIEDLKATDKWTFTFMGTSNALDQAKGMGIDPGNTTVFSDTADGMENATILMKSSLRSYYGARNMGMTSMDTFYDKKEE